ncbi:unnamed protein product [Oppiella nova]|uniref:Uncharacterized protein n=1 Tax=Oppiella nova TaxID=334625 RepID=A0A7R9QDF2_9ACAR|nr:unnamed protein product [Oppiella nova]CAG2163650.1 unnamed protein product [Oppiella nova]
MCVLMSSVKALLVTANVGSLFAAAEDNSEPLLLSWIARFKDTLLSLRPQFVALHCQEVGGKSEVESRRTPPFVRALLNAFSEQDFPSARLFVDQLLSRDDAFTALANAYFVHKSLAENAFIFNFKEQRFESVGGREVHSGDIEDNAFKDKRKFPQHFFPQVRRIPVLPFPHSLSLSPAVPVVSQGFHADAMAASGGRRLRPH